MSAESPGVDWQTAEVDRLRAALPAGSTVAPYGSSAHGRLDGWSDLDVRIGLSTPALDLARLLDAELWTWSAAVDRDAQVVRAVLVDGRRIDARVTGGRLRLPPHPVDREVRFDLALAATRIGRGDRLVGLHLLLGVVREALVHAMQLRDRDESVSNHPHGTDRDRMAVDALETLIDDGRDLLPDAAMRVAELSGRWRRELEPEYLADWSGLRAVIARGRAEGPTDR